MASPIAAAPAGLARGELRFDGRVAVVTGAGGGLGKAYALLLASRGAKVVVNDLGGSVSGSGSDTRAAQRVVEEIRAGGGVAVPDYHTVEDGDSIIQTAIASFGRIDILICNAGILRDATFGKMELGAWEAVYQVHLRGSYKCARAAWKYMREQGYGRIVFVTSSSGLYGNVGQANYAAAKMGIVGLANTLAREGNRRGIVVNTIAPIAASRMTESLMPPDLLEALRPETVAPFVAYLCHEACTSSGGIFELGGGWVSKLRWQRSKGVHAVSSVTSPATALEAVAEKWKEVDDFEDAAYPDSTQSSFEPILKGIATEQPPGNGDEIGAAAAREVNAAKRPSVSHSIAEYLPPLPGGNFGLSDAVDVPAALKHPFKRKLCPVHKCVMNASDVWGAQM